MNESIYPLSPQNINARLTKLPFTYHLKAGTAVLSVLLFFALYIGLVIGSLFLLYFTLIYEIEVINKWTILLKIGSIAAAGMLFAFTLKFIFKIKNPPITNRIKLSKKDYPELWDFVYKICKETGAPKPKNIYADPDVNAYVAYSNMWLSLFLPVRKELTIGMGLVSCLNLSEFKAVISHEFGHFSQKSMTIGSYIITANTIIHDMIFSRDKWDELLEKWQSLDFRLSFAAYLLMPIIFLIRQLLNLFYQLLNVMHSLLSKEMEFNADKVAVSTSGSEAIVSGLWKLDSGNEAWNKTLGNAYLASQKQMFIKNLYTHNMNRISEKSEVIKKQIQELPDDERGGKLFFTRSENSKVSMYASHPANDQREASAKKPYVFCEQDDRSPWILFSNKEKLQEEMSGLIYKLYWNKKPEAYTEEAVFEDFIKEELKGENLQEEYFNTFEKRYVSIPKDEVLKDKSNSFSENTELNLSVLKSQLKELMQPIEEIEALMKRLEKIAQGTSKEKAVKFGGVMYNKKNLQRGYDLMMKKRDQIFNEKFTEWDSDFFSFHYGLARVQDRGKELLKLYHQHQLIVGFYRKVVSVKVTIMDDLFALQNREGVTDSHIISFQQRIKELVRSLNDDMNVFNNATFVPLSNINSVEDVKNAIVENGSFIWYEGPIFKNGGFGKMMDQLERALMHCQRIEQKSIGAILQYHKELNEKSVVKEVN